MIFINIKAQLGNNLFQYSFLRYIAEVNSTADYRLSGDLLQIIKLKRFFAINVNLVNSVFDVIIFKITKFLFSEKKAFNLIKVQYGRDKNHEIYYEKHHNLNLSLEPNENYIFDGWFQSYQYVVKENIKYRDYYIKIAKAYLESNKIFDLSNYCCIHARYKDYFESDMNMGGGYGWVLPISYYSKAVNEIITSTKGNTSNLKFIVISDNINLAKRIIDFLPNDTLYSSHPDPIVDMIIMSMSQFNIISNSTFAWWGAMLNFSDNPLIIAPRYFIGFNKSFEFPPGIYPQNWLQVDFPVVYGEHESRIFDEYLRSKAESKNIGIWKRVKEKIKRSSKNFLKNLLKII
jgi:hypothetical protein